MDIQEIIGTDYRSINLKPLGKRLRNRRMIAERRQPSVVLIVTSDKRKYKLLEVDDSNNSRFLRIREMLDVLSGLDFVPSIMWTDERRILAEYIDGECADFRKERFAREIGKHLAKLHSLNVGTTDVDDYYSRIVTNLEYLASKKAFSLEMMLRVSDKLNELRPDVLRTSMVYANMHNGRNYVFTNDNRLYLIDLGSFQEDRVTDDVLFGYRLFKALDVKTFWESYFESGGTKYIYDNQHFLKLAQHIKKAAKHLRSYHKKPFYDLWQKRLSNKRFRWMMKELIAEMERF